MNPENFRFKLLIGLERIEIPVSWVHINDKKLTIERIARSDLFQRWHKSNLEKYLMVCSLDKDGKVLTEFDFGIVKAFNYRIKFDAADCGTLWETFEGTYK